MNEDERVFETLKQTEFAVILAFDKELQDVIIISKGGLSKLTVKNVLLLAAEELERAIVADNIKNN